MMNRSLHEYEKTFFSTNVALGVMKENGYRCLEIITADNGFHSSYVKEIIEQLAVAEKWFKDKEING